MMKVLIVATTCVQLTGALLAGSSAGRSVRLSSAVDGANESGADDKVLHVATSADIVCASCAFEPNNLRSDIYI